MVNDVIDRAAPPPATCRPDEEICPVDRREHQRSRRPSQWTQGQSPRHLPIDAKEYWPAPHNLLVVIVNMLSSFLNR